MFRPLLERTRQKLTIETAKAHCDIPCGIYDTAPALISALTVVRMVDLMDEVKSGGKPGDLEYENKMSRCVAQKEEHAEQVKHEVRIIWGDYFKAPQLEKFPQTHELVHKIMMQGSKCRQSANRDEAVKLVELVNEFAEIFWATKGVKTKKAVCPYEPKLETVYPVL